MKWWTRLKMRSIGFPPPRTRRHYERRTKYYSSVGAWWELKQITAHWTTHWFIYTKHMRSFNHLAGQVCESSPSIHTYICIESLLHCTQKKKKTKMRCLFDVSKATRLGNASLATATEPLRRHANGRQDALVRLLVGLCSRLMWARPPFIYYLYICMYMHTYRLILCCINAQSFIKPASPSHVRSGAHQSIVPSRRVPSRPVPAALNSQSTNRSRPLRKTSHNGC